MIHASPQPLSKGEGLKVLSFGEDPIAIGLDEAKNI